MNYINKGDVFTTQDGGRVVVLEYINWKEVVVQHLDEHGYIHTVRSERVASGSIRNPYKPSVLGVGYTGAGKYVTKQNGVRTPEYEAWKGMLKRAYCSKYKKRKPTYENVTVHEEWHNFQNFAKWWHEQPNSGKQGFCLDKDLRIWNNKEYSSAACSYLPTRINNLLTDSARIRGDYPQGVSFVQGRYIAKLKVNNGKRRHLGTYKDVVDADMAYRKGKAEYVKEVAEEYKHVLHPEVCNNLINWELT